MPAAKDAPEPAFIAMQSLPVPIPFIQTADGPATATYDLIRVLDVAARHDTLIAPFLTEAARIDAARAALDTDPPDADTRAAREAELRAAGEVNQDAYHLYLLDYTRCQVSGINPAPVPGQADSWKHLHPALRRWLAQQGRAAAEAQMAAPLTQLMGPRFVPR